jgi:hypothetical protein
MPSDHRCARPSQPDAAVVTEAAPRLTVVQGSSANTTSAVALRTSQAATARLRALPPATEAQRATARVSGPSSERSACGCARARSSLQLRAGTTRFWLPDPAGFAQIAIDFDDQRGTFLLLCFRYDGQGALKTANALPNRYRLRELEATLMDLNVALPATLRRYFIAVLVDDVAELTVLEPQVHSLLCCRSQASAVA